MQRFLLAFALSVSSAFAAEPAAVRSAPRMQALPLPDAQISFQYDGKELTRYHFGSQHERPFLYPVIGPSGRSVTRMGHPRDPEGHSHHNSVWISHQHVDGINFWEDRGPGKVVHERIEKLGDSDTNAVVTTSNIWIDESTKRPLMMDRRRIEVRPLSGNELLILIDLEFAPPSGKSSVALGDNAFGFLGVRLAKSIGVNDGGGTIRNSEGLINEMAVFRKPTRWVDYSGAILGSTIEGVTVFDHPTNISHPTPFHVRNDGWFCPSVTLGRPIEATKEKPLKLRYALYVHSGNGHTPKIAEQFENFSQSKASSQ